MNKILNFDLEYPGKTPSEFHNVFTVVESKFLLRHFFQSEKRVSNFS